MAWFTKSAKPPSPVQIRAAPPTILKEPSVKRVETSAAALKGSLSVAYVGSFKSAGEKVSSDTGCTSVPSGATDFAECISA
jgi:hypothetical protein